MAKKLETAPRVLVVDDEPDLLTLMQLTLTKLGLEVVTPLIAVKAHWRRSTARPIHLCLTDMQLGDGTGLDVLAASPNAGLTCPAP